MKSLDFTDEELRVIYSSVIVCWMRKLAPSDEPFAKSIIAKLEEYKGMGVTKQ